MRIAVNFENLPQDGGAFHENILLIEVFKEFEKKNNIEILYIVSNKKVEKLLKEKKCKTIFFEKKRLIFKIQNFLYKFIFFRYILTKLKISNVFEKFIKQKKINLVFFNNPSELSILSYNLLYVIVFYELQHLQHNYLPEYKSYHSFDLREIVIKNLTKTAFKIVTCVEKDKYLLQKYYNAIAEKIVVQPFVSRLPLIFEEDNKKTNFKDLFKKMELDINQKYLFYPAQFWPHKNHRYIIDSMNYIVNEKKIKDYKVIFCGFDKFKQKNFLKKIIEKNNLQNYFLFFDYLSDNQIISLYLHSHCLVMPTLVGHYSLPLFESFYFKLPAIFTSNLLDNSLQKYTWELNLNDNKDLLKKIEEIDSDQIKKNQIIDEAHIFYSNNFKLQNIYKNYENIFLEAKKILNMWNQDK